MKKYVTLNYFLSFLLIQSAAEAAMPNNKNSELSPLVIQWDEGGLLIPRLKKIERLAREGREVRITGSFCKSACTMYLGLENVCVAPNTRFGFHGPTNWFLPARGDAFEIGSQIMGDTYPDAIRDWYMEEGRYKTWGYYWMLGSELMRHGIAECQEQ